jgi:hypothetical protein
MQAQSKSKEAMRTARIAPVLRCERNHSEITISGNVVCMDDGQRHIERQAEFGSVCWLRTALACRRALQATPRPNLRINVNI